jgi:hypothetical protein
MMYDPKSNVGDVITEYENYYKTNPFTKNEHTQYYKRWLRNIREVVDERGYINPPSKKIQDQRDAERISGRTSNGSRSIMVNPPSWKTIGPIDFDKEAAGRSHAPGAAHVYTIEKAPSNPDILYCGTANAGIWKTIDRGLHWTYASATIPVNYCNAIEIHPSDPNTVWIGANNRLYVTHDGGTSWSVAGDAQFNTISYSFDDIAYKPGTTNVLFLATNQGIYRSIDGGNNFAKILSTKGGKSHFGEIEFKPDDPNTVYALLNEVNDKYTELYKSVDGGNTFSILSSWPVLASSTPIEYRYVEKTASSNQYASFVNDNLGTSAVPNFTIEMRAKFPNASADKAFLSNKNWSTGANNGWTLSSRYTGQLTFNIGNGSSRIDLHSDAIWDGQWHQISIVYRATGTKELFVDGILKASSNTNITLNANTGLPMVLGRDGNLGFGAVDMQIDEFRIWNTALTSAEMNPWNTGEVNNTHPKYANLLHYYKCNEASGNTLIDEVSSNTGTMTGSWVRSTFSSFLTTTNLPADDHQKRAEIAVTAANPNKIYALLAGSAYGGTGLFGVYESVDSGNSWTHKCCGTGPGGPASISNPNLLGYASNGNEEGGQYYYDLALEADPNNASKIHIGGVNHWYSTNSGETFTNTGHWANPSGVGYVHADVHNIKVYGNEVWVVNDGGIFMSQDSGKVVFNKRQYGIAGTEFWGFGMGHKDADVMVGGTLHNSHLMKNNDVYINGWISYTGSADGTRGFVNPGKPKQVYTDAGRDIIPPTRTQSPQSLPFHKKPNTQPISKVAWHPRCYNCVYTGNLTGLWYSPNDGYSWELVKDFSPFNVGDIEIAWDNPNIIWVTGVAGLYDPKKIWKSTDGGLTWADVTPSPSTLGFSSDMYYNITVSDNNQHVWMNVFHRHEWYTYNNNKIWFSADGGSTWTNVTTSLLYNQNINDVVYHRGSNDGIYVGTNKSVYYRDNSTGGFIDFSTGLPLSISTTKLHIWYREGKIRQGGNQSVWESKLHKLAPPIAKPIVDKLKSLCTQDTFYFADYSAHYKTGATFTWSFSPPPLWVSSTQIENPKVVFGTAGTYTASLTVSDSLGISTGTINNIVVSNNGCTLDTIPGNAMRSLAAGDYAIQERPMNFSSNTMTLSAWIKPEGGSTEWRGIIFAQGTGIRINPDGELRYHWNGGKWDWSSGLIAPTNQWSHVALVITPTASKLYLNGQLATNISNHSVLNFTNPFYIGIEPTYSSRTFLGQIDEVCIYTRALTTDEVRELMHLTKNPANDPSLKAYYQFNTNNANFDVDKVGNNNLIFNLNTTRVKSTAPVGKGVSQTIAITNGGLKNFAIPGVQMYFPSAGTYPNGNVVVSKINQRPDTIPTGGIAAKAYWVVNNYGTNQTFTVLDSITFGNSGNISAGCSPSMYELYRRPFNGEGTTWATSIDMAERFNVINPSEVAFKANNNMTTFGQLYIRNNNTPSNDTEVCNSIDDNCNGLTDESYSTVVTSTADSGINTLRQILLCAQDGDIITFAPNVDTITLLSPIVISKNVSLVDENGNNVVLKANLNASGFTSANAAIRIEATATSSWGNITIVHTNNSSAKPAVLNLGHLSMSLCELIGNPKTIMVHSPNASFTVARSVLIK